jgi:hypothetical protein
MGFQPMELVLEFFAQRINSPRSASLATEEAASPRADSLAYERTT